MTLESQIMALEGVNLNAQVFDAMQVGAQAMNQATRNLGGVEAVEEVIDSVEDGIQARMANPNPNPDPDPDPNPNPNPNQVCSRCTWRRPRTTSASSSCCWPPARRPTRWAAPSWRRCTWRRAAARCAPSLGCSRRARLRG